MNDNKLNIELYQISFVAKMCKSAFLLIFTKIKRFLNDLRASQTLESLELHWDSLGFMSVDVDDYNTCTGQSF